MTNLTQLCYPRIVGSQTLPRMNMKSKRAWISDGSNWKGFTDPEWIHLAQLNCEALLYEFDQGAKARARFQAMQAGDDHPGN
ncbi:hypothetical protein PHMEG_00036221 [Phytophthora megakarya]|uniref:Uncharacterized protein n=1 Tax=Phytophthora megakarya TaxID=4795 RepID=A0A225UNL0_9STRA|nr:hypothetical protein PHMEG_00036221 [Phytophthora megakarya]